MTDALDCTSLTEIKSSKSWFACVLLTLLGSCGREIFVKAQVHTSPLNTRMVHHCSASLASDSHDSYHQGQSLKRNLFLLLHTS